MFQSEPICILTAGPTIDGRNVEQQMVDDIAETYNPKTYNARINEEHWGWGEKFGSVVSVEKRGKELWGILKPNSKLLGTIEKGQLLHTSCEITPDYAKTGKFYLTGLALTDSPASIGTTEMHLSDNAGKKMSFCTGSVISLNEFSLKNQTNRSQEEQTLFSRLLNMIGSEKYNKHQEEEPEMSKELENLITLSVKENKKTNDLISNLVIALSENKNSLTKESDTEHNSIEVKLGKLTEQILALSKDKKIETPPEKTAVEKQIDMLSAQIEALTTKLSNATDEENRLLSGSKSDEETYL